MQLRSLSLRALMEKKDSGLGEQVFDIEDGKLHLFIRIFKYWYVPVCLK